MGKKLSTRTILVVAFLAVALVTPVFAGVTYQAVQDTDEKSQELIENSIRVTNLTEESVETSHNVVQNVENVGYYLDESQQGAASEEADQLTENFEDFISTTNELLDHMEESEEDFTEEEEAIRSSQQEMEALIQQTLAYEQQGTALAGTIIEDSQEELNTITETSTAVSTRVLNSESSELLSLTEQLGDLSTTILVAGVLTVVGGVGVALVISVLISRPVKNLNKEAEKIQREDFDNVNLEKVDTHIREFDDFKEVMEDVVIALKSEFDREREGMNDLALDLVSILSEELPQGVAESSLSSAAEKAGVSPVDMKKKDANEIIKNLEVSTRGLGVNDEVFEEMRERID